MYKHQLVVFSRRFTAYYVLGTGVLSGQVQAFLGDKGKKREGGSALQQKFTVVLPYSCIESMVMYEGNFVYYGELCKRSMPGWELATEYWARKAPEEYK